MSFVCGYFRLSLSHTLLSLSLSHTHRCVTYVVTEGREKQNSKFQKTEKGGEKKQNEIREVAHASIIYLHLQFRKQTPKAGRTGTIRYVLCESLEHGAMGHWVSSFLLVESADPHFSILLVAAYVCCWFGR